MIEEIYWNILLNIKINKDKLDQKYLSLYVKSIEIFSWIYFHIVFILSLYILTVVRFDCHFYSFYFFFFLIRWRKM